MKLCGFEVGLDQPFFLIAGPCVIESEQLQMDTAGTLKEITASLGIPFIFKSSFDKARNLLDENHVIKEAIETGGITWESIGKEFQETLPK